MSKIQRSKVLSFIKEATKVLQKHKVKKPYYIKIHNVNKGKAIPISDFKNIVFKNGEIMKKAQN